MATTHYYVSSEATNGYAVGNDANDGLSKNTPFLTLDPFEAAGFTWTDDDTIHLNGAEIDCSAGLTLDGSCTIEGDVDKTQINMRSVTPSNYGILFANGKTHTLRHCVVHYGGCTTAPIEMTTAVSLCTIVLDDVEVVYQVWGIYSPTTNLLVDLTLSNVKLTASYTATAGSCGLYAVSLGTGSAIDIDDVELDVTYNTITSTRGGIMLKANVAGLDCNVNHVFGKVSRASLTTNFTALSISDFATFEVANCDLAVRGTGGAYGIHVTSATQTVTSGSVHDNHVRATTPDGIVICIGHDTTANVCNGVKAYNNRVSGIGRTAGGALHGMLIGNNADCHAYNNIIEGCYYGIISKETTASLISYNIARFIETAGIAWYAKGGDASVWVGNGHIVEGANNGTTFVVGPNALNNSTGVVLAGNWRYDYYGATEAQYFVSILADQEIVAYGNNWYRVEGTPETPFYHVDGAKTLVEWNALANVTGDTAFRFAPRHRTRMDHRLLSLATGV